MTNNDKQALHGKRNKNDDWKRKTVGHITPTTCRPQSQE